jgi:hypothetical protein
MKTNTTAIIKKKCDNLHHIEANSVQVSFFKLNLGKLFSRFPRDETSIIIT